MNLLGIVSTVFGLIWLNIKIWFYLVEAFYRLIVPPAPKDIRGKVVLITGGGGGIGRALASEFGKCGAHVVVWDINQNAVVETATLVREQGFSCEAYVCDVTNKSEVENVAQEVRKNIGDVDILVNNAGVFPCKALLDLSEQEIRRTLDVNTIAPFWTTQAFLPRMIERQSGHLVTICSMASKVGVPLCTDYAASKAGIYGMVEALRAELRMQGHYKIECSVVCPMIVDTGLIHQFMDRITIKDRFGRIYQPNYVAEQVVSRVSRNEKYIYIPPDKRSVGIINEAMPYKARMALFDFIDAGFSEKEQVKKLK